jgi:hypothetical protein
MEHQESRGSLAGMCHQDGYGLFVRCGHSSGLTKHLIAVHHVVIVARFVIFILLMKIFDEDPEETRVVTEKEGV